MSPELMKQQTRRFPEELLTQGDLSVIPHVFAENSVHHGLFRSTAGASGLERSVLALRQAFPDLCASIEAEEVEAGRVVQHVTLSGTHRGTFLGLPPTGRRAVWSLLAVYAFGATGSVIEQWLARSLRAPQPDRDVCDRKTLPRNSERSLDESTSIRGSRDERACRRRAHRLHATATAAVCIGSPTRVHTFGGGRR